MTAQINGIPVYSATLETDECGIYRVSFVDFPAVESDFVALAARKPQMFSVADEEKRLVRGVLMRADFPIYRYDAYMGEYYIVYHADTIRQMAEKFLKEGRVNEVNQMHIPFSEVRGVEMHQIFIKDSAAGINPEGFDDIADGSLFVEYHVTNDEVWASVKNGTYRGFSLEGIFTFEPEPAEDEEQQILSQISHHLKHNNMTFIERLKALLAAQGVQFKNVTTDKGVISWEGDDDLAVDMEVFIEDEEGNRTPVADGDYTLEDGTVIRVANGKVTEIVEVEAEPEDNGGEDTTDERLAAEVTPETITALEERIDALEALVAKLQTTIDEIAKGAEMMATEMATIKKQPAAKTAKEQFAGEGDKPKVTGIKGLDTLMRNLPKK